MALGIFFCAVGIGLLHRGGMITGGIAGLSLLVALFAHQPVGALVWVLNVPFVAFAFAAMGRGFGAKTLVVSAVLGASIEFVSRSLNVSEISSAFSAIGGGTLLGTGILFLARHNASLGGTGAVVLWLQKRYGLNAGVSQLGIDAVLFIVASALLPWPTVVWSLLGTLAMNAMVIVWHKPGRYHG
ncbi:YitT family protein [Variovorax sp. LT2P21]|uniref:YitT family protein n=1 Tax=Variovorax sp. LT2P21 TaxID=3443731 RepID=UPI003F45591B